jgi:hypothetical protein
MPLLQKNKESSNRKILTLKSIMFLGQAGRKGRHIHAF